MPAVAGLRGTGDWGTDERPKNFRQGILFRNPNGMTPLLALMGKVSEESVDDPEFAWWDEPVDIVRLQINNGAGYTAGATTFVVDSGDQTSTSANYGLATHLKPGDLLLVEKTEVQAHDAEVIMVTSVTSATQFDVARGQAGTTAGAIADNTWLTKIGSAYAEGSSKPNAASRNPVKYYNYCQIFKTLYSLTRTAIKTKARTGPVLENDKKRKTFDHSKDIEMALLWGQRYETTGSNGKPLRFMGGLRQFIPASNTTIFGATTTWQQWLDATVPVFDWDTPSGNERIIFCGNKYLNVLNNIARLNGDINFTETVKVYGLDLQKIITPQGTLYLKTHPMMNRHSKFSASAFILDFAALKYKYLRDTFFEDDVQTPGDDQKQGQWITECSLEVRFGGATLGYHGNLTAAA